MSNTDFIETFKFKTNWKPDSSFLKSSSELMLRTLVGFGSEEEEEGFNKRSFLNKDNVYYFWNLYPSARPGIISKLSESIEYANSYWRSSAHFDKDFSESILREIYSEIPDDENKKNITLRHRISIIINEEIDCLKKIHKYKLMNDNDLYHIWYRHGLRHSMDSKFFEFALSSVKRAPGSTKIKIDIINAAASNNAIGDNMIKTIAKRGTKTQKRTIVSHLSDTMCGMKRRLPRVHGHAETSPDASAEQIDAQKKIDLLESKLMMFVDCDDTDVVENLMLSLSKDNLPWLMPAASKNSYLSSRLQRMIEREGGGY
jgi:hypothetical protein|tara:strand:- start:3667 stop:4611 length:945 start_codon:yes stop_codon:yes gene_type:complete